MIRIRGAREHNLRGVDLDLDPGQIVVLCGRSGSGKSSLVFDTLHAEGQRRYLEALAMRTRGAIPQLPRPDVDLLDGIPPTVALEQRFDLPTGRSTVGTFTEIDALLRVLFGRAGTQHDPVTGEAITPVTHDGIVAALLALPDGARLTLEAPVRRSGRDAGALLAEIARSGFSRVRIGGVLTSLDAVGPLDLPPDTAVRVVVDRIRIGPDRKDRLYDAVRTTSAAGQGVVIAVTDDGEARFVDRPWSASLEQVLPELRPALFRVGGPDPCPDCEGRGDRDGAACAACRGTGAGPATRAARFAGWTWPDVQHETIAGLSAASRAWPQTPVTTPLIEELTRRFEALSRVGLAALRPARSLSQLSSSEVRRIRLARQVGARLSGVLYALDEPAAGLDAAGVDEVIALIRSLRDQGNTVVVVEHDPRMIAAADRVIEFGPGAGELGGHVVFDGPVSALPTADTPTGRWLSGRERLDPLRIWWAAPDRPGRGDGDAPPLRLTGGAARGREDITLDLRRGRVNVISGAPASGKTAALEALSAAVASTLDGRGSEGLAGAEGLTRLVHADAEAASRSRRSTLATYVGIWETIRELLAATQEARVRGLDAASFSLNLRGGRCEACRGLGVVHVDLTVLPEVSMPCEVCEGRRFARDVLEVRYKGLDAGQMLGLSADDALGRLAGHPRVEDGLRALREVGLGYVRLGQPTDTLSGGEAQRLKLARELMRALRSGGEGALFLLDEPALGLHPADVQTLMALFGRLVATGGTVVLATSSAWLIEALAQASD